jgi:polysaccharide transporter, PST family
MTFWRTSVRNFVSKLAGEGGVRIFSFLFVFVLARRLGASDFGVYSTVIAYVSLFNIAIELASNAIIMRDIARSSEERVKAVSSANFLKLALSVAAFIGLHVVVRWTALASLPRLLIDCLGILVISYSLIDYAGILFAGKELMGREASLRVICRAIIAASGLVCMIFTRSLLVIAATVAATGLLSLFVSQVILRREFHIGGAEIDRVMMRRILIRSLPLLGTYTFSLVYDNQDILLMKHFHMSDAAIGYFWSANKVLDVLKVLPFLLVGAFFPSLSRLHGKRQEFMRLIKHLAAYSIFLIPLVVIAGYLGAPLIQELLYGPDFVSAAPYLRLLMIAYAGIFANYVSTYVLISGNHENKLLPGAAAVCVINFFLCWRLIPPLGPLGVCYALIASEWLYFLYLTSLLLWTLYPRAATQEG